jgi:hypothetical protein
VLEHLESPLRLIRELANRMNDGAWLILTTPNVDSLGSRIERLVRGHDGAFSDYWYDANGHISPVSLLQLERIAARVGFALECVTYNVGQLPVPKFGSRHHVRARWGRTRLLGLTLIVKLRKDSSVAARFVRG